MKLSILLADDHAIVRGGIRSILQARPEWSILAEVADGSEAVQKATELKPDVAVLDVGLPGLNGLEAARRIRQALPQTEIVVLTVDDSEHTLRQAVNCGVRGYVLKSNASDHLLDAIQSASQHEFFVSPNVAYHENATSMCLLTYRESEILVLLAQGFCTKEIAAQLHVAIKTAATHRTNLMRKIGAHCLADLVRYAIRNRLIAA
jgi:DNA-binding NarL/FixJ family response regulator